MLKTYKALGNRTRLRAILAVVFFVVMSLVAIVSMAEGNGAGDFWYLPVFAGFIAVWVVTEALSIPHEIRWTDDGRLHMWSYRRTESIEVSDILSITPWGDQLKVRLRGGRTLRWNRHYSELYELLSLLKEHNPTIELRGL